MRYFHQNKSTEILSRSTSFLIEALRENTTADQYQSTMSALFNQDLTPDLRTLFQLAHTNHDDPLPKQLNAQANHLNFKFSTSGSVTGITASLAADRALPAAIPATSFVNRISTFPKANPDQHDIA